MIPAFQGFYVNLLLCIGLTLLLSTLSNRDVRIRLFLFALAVFFNARYILWRAESTLPMLEPSFASVWQWNFFLAEVGAVLLLSWHLMILVSRPRTPPVDTAPLPFATPPSVDVFVPTLNEPVELLRPTLQAAKAIDYPNFTVWVLDDGNRAWLRELCEEEGVRYLARSERKGFKAGNMNNGLRHARGEFILSLDADFVAFPQILRRTLGYFTDPRIGIVQTPQHFANADAIQHNLGGQQAWPEDQRVFTDMIQPCRDNWDNAFCYGSNFVVRRAYLDAIGGFPEKTICEDIFLTYALKQHGWITRYHNEPLAVGQAAGTLSEFIKQRVRWCCGTLQALFQRGGPILTRRLSLLDRLFYLDPALFYLSSAWAFLIMISPIVFWWTSVPPFQSNQGHLLMMLLPRMWVSMLGLYWLTDRKVVPIVSEIGRHVSIFHMLGAAIRTLLRPFGSSFKVTLKDSTRSHTTINWAVLWPHLCVTGLTMGGFIYFYLRGGQAKLIWDENLGLILALTIYVLWMNFFSIMACIEPALEPSRAGGDSIAHRGSIRRSLAALTRKVVQ